MLKVGNFKKTRYPFWKIKGEREYIAHCITIKKAFTATEEFFQWRKRHVISRNSKCIPRSCKSYLETHSFCRVFYFVSFGATAGFLGNQTKSLGRMTYCVTALHSELESSWSQSHEVLSQTLGPNFVTRLQVTFGSKLVSEKQWLT